MLKHPVIRSLDALIVQSHKQRKPYKNKDQAFDRHAHFIFSSFKARESVCCRKLQKLPAAMPINRGCIVDQQAELQVKF